jgi:tetratricopeptide (TPR) repeat protein
MNLLTKKYHNALAFLLTLALGVVVVSCASTSKGTSNAPFGMAAQVEALTVDEQGRKFDNLFLAAINHGLAGNDDTKFALLCEAQQLAPHAPEVYYEMAKMASENPALVKESVLESPEILLQKALCYAPHNRDIRMDLLGELIGKRKYNEAIAQCDTLLASKYTESMAARKYALYEAVGNYKQAYSVAEEIVRRGGDEQEWGGNMYDLLQRSEDAAFAVKKARERYEANPENFQIGVEYFSVLMNYNKLEAAKEVCNTMVSKNPDNVDALGQEIYFILITKDTTTVAQEKVRRYMLNPKAHSEYKVLICNHYPTQLYGQTKEAYHAREAYLTLGLSVEQQTPALLTYLADKLSMEQTLVDSEEANTVISETTDANASSQEYNSIIAERQKQNIHPLINKDSVFVVYEKILEMNPAEENVRYKLLDHYVAVEDHEALEKLCLTAMQYGEHVNMYGYYGALSLLQKGKTDKALALLRRATEAGEDEEYPQMVSTVYELIGYLESQNDNKTASLAAYEKAFALYPYNAQLANNVAYALCEFPDSLQRAEELVLYALDMDQSKAYIWDTYACVLYKKADYQGAKKAIDKSLELLTDDTPPSNYYLRAGDIYFMLGKKDDALKFWKKALQTATDDKNKAEINKRIKTKRIPADK